MIDCRRLAAEDGSQPVRSSIAQEDNVSSRAKPNLLTHNGAIYEIESDALADLVSAGVVVPDQESQGAFRLSPDHLFDEVDQHAIPVWRRSGFDPRFELMRMLSSHRDGQGGG
jgi:hypothetical protein